MLAASIIKEELEVVHINSTFARRLIPDVPVIKSLCFLLGRIIYCLLRRDAIVCAVPLLVGLHRLLHRLHHVAHFLASFLRHPLALVAVTALEASPLLHLLACVGRRGRAIVIEL